MIHGILDRGSEECSPQGVLNEWRPELSHNLERTEQRSLTSPPPKQALNARDDSIARGWNHVEVSTSKYSRIWLLVLDLGRHLSGVVDYGSLHMIQVRESSKQLGKEHSKSEGQVCAETIGKGTPSTVEAGQGDLWGWRKMDKAEHTDRQTT